MSFLLLSLKCVLDGIVFVFSFFFFSSRRRHTRCALVTGVQTCALPIFGAETLTFDTYVRQSIPEYFSAGEPEAARTRQLVRILAQRIGDLHAQIGKASCRERVC